MSSPSSPPKSLQPPSSVFGLSKAVLFQSVSHCKQHFRVFVVIVIVLALPLSLLTSSLISASHPIKSRIHLLHFIASQADVGFEARQAWREAREYALSLIRLKFMYFVPCSILSLVVAISTVSSVAASYSHRAVDVKLALSAVRNHWFLPMVTSIFNYVVLIAYSLIPRMMVVMAGGEMLKMMFWFLGLGIEVYLVTVMSMAMVVSIVEDHSGWDAMLIGSKLIEGRRLCGLVLCSSMMLMTGAIVHRMESFLTGERVMWTRFSGWMTLKVKRQPWRWEWSGLACLYAVLVVWGYILTTILYCECRKRQAISRDITGDEEDLEL